ncbi:MAG: beta-L-arabinofuranosidase domain-containing protein [Thermoguttaceae bacterium]
MRNNHLRSVGVIAGFFFVVAAVFVVIASAAEPAATGKANYERPFEPPSRSALIPLPPGAVEPAGWLRDWCVAAKDGYTATMNQRDPAFRQAWAKDYQMHGDHVSAWELGGWPYEGGGYWFDGLAKLGYVLHDKALIEQAKSRLGVVVDNMTPNSILFMWWLDKNKPEDINAVYGKGKREEEWPIWANGLMGRSLVGYYAGSRDPRILKALETAYSSNRDWVRLGWSMIHPWPALETYTWTGNQEIKESLTALFSKEGDDKKPGSWNRYRRPPSDKPGAEPADHGVHFCESTAPWALGYLWTGKREFLDAALRWHDKIERECMQPYGVPVFDEYYGPTGAFRGTETCDVAAYIWSQDLLLTISGQGRLADRIERAFFNAGPATVSRDFKTHVYMQSPNRMADHRLPAAEPFTYKTKHDPLCCTAAVNRILPNYVINMWMATRDNGLAATCYGPCKVSALVADRVPVEIACRTDYPFNETIEIAVKLDRVANFPLMLRIPGWCRYPGLEVNGMYTDASPDANGFVRLEREWRPNDTISLRFRMFPEVATGRDANVGGAPYGSVSLGPLLFALPIADAKDANMPDSVAKWQFALDARSGIVSPDFAVERGPMPDKWNWPLKSPLKLRARAMSIDWKPTLEKSLPPKPFDGGKSPQWITLVPYGCTKFRVSMFPVTKWTFEKPETPKDSEGWGPEINGLRTRLLPVQKVYFVGRPALVQLEAKNFAMFEATYDPQQADVNDSMLIRGPDGKRVPYVAGMYQTGSTGPRSLAPGETDMLISGLDLASQYLFTKPGSYTIQFRGLPALGQGFGQAIPPSGEITVKMQPGKLPFEMQVPARLLEVLPAEWDIRLNMRVAEVESGNVHPPGWKTGPGTYVELVSHPNKEESTPNVEIWVAKRRLVPKNAKAGQPAVYLGEGADGHVYWQVNAKAKTAWPDIEKKVKAALRIATPEAKARAAK